MNNALAATRRIGLAIVAFLVLASTGHAADFSAWAKTTSLTFSGYSKPETLTDFPVLVVLSTDISGFSYSDFQSPAHDDLRFTDEAGTELSYEVESWDPAGKSYVWVKLPSLVNSATKIYAFWGMAGQTAPAYTTNGSTWTSSYVAVYHLATVGSILSAADATRVNNGTVVGDPAATAGKVDGGGSFLTGGNNNISIPDSPSTRITGKLTLSAWINPTSINATYPGEIIEKRNDDASEMNYGMWLWNDGTLNFHFFDSDYRIFNSTGTVSLSTWTYVTIVVDESAPTKLSMYLNGSLDSTPAYTGSMVSRTSPLHIGSGPYGDSYQFKGSEDFQCCAIPQLGLGLLYEPGFQQRFRHRHCCRGRRQTHYQHNCGERDWDGQCDSARFTEQHGQDGNRRICLLGRHGSGNQCDVGSFSGISWFCRTRRLQHQRDTGHACGDLLLPLLCDQLQRDCLGQ